MPVRSALASAALLLAGCGIVGSDPGEFEATLTDADGASTALSGPAVYDLQEGGGTVLLLPRGDGLGSEIRIEVARAALAEGAVALGPTAAVAYVVRNGRATIGVDPDNPPRPVEGGALVYPAADGTLTLTRVTDDEVEGRVTATVASGENGAAGLEARFRAVVP